MRDLRFDCEIPPAFAESFGVAGAPLGMTTVLVSSRISLRSRAALRARLFQLVAARSPRALPAEPELQARGLQQQALRARELQRQGPLRFSEPPWLWQLSLLQLRLLSLPPLPDSCFS